jgi:hypothetical protein
VKHAPVFVPSRGRAGRVKPEVLGLSPTLVVEAWDAPNYRRAYPNHVLLVLTQKDRGIAYARNCALAGARLKGYAACWVLDDDLSDFTQRIKGAPGKWTRQPIEAAQALTTAEHQLAQGPPVALAGIAAAFNKKPPESVTYNGNVACCVRYDLARLGPLAYRECLRLGEDTDMALQAITTHRGTARLNDFDYQTPLYGTSTGGLQAEYEDLELKAALVQKLCAFWPGLVRAKPGATTYQIDWERIEQGQLSAPSEAFAARQASPSPSGCYAGATATRGGR